MKTTDAETSVIDEAVNSAWDKAYAHFRGEGVPANLLNWMCINKSDALTLSEVIANYRPRRILEVGTFLGFSAAVMGQLAPTSEIVTIDPNYPLSVISTRFGYESDRRVLDYAKNCFDALCVSDRITLIEGYFADRSASYLKNYVEQWGGDPRTAGKDQGEIVESAILAQDPFDMIFIDGDHSETAVYSDLMLAAKMIAPDGVIVMDDIYLEGDFSIPILAGLRRMLAEVSNNRVRPYEFFATGGMGILRLK
ncbi:class I SAM-dependent methyltransferase [Streptomyces sp. NPDC051572]|jgi:predicted O-methyltransferase YrrM|uniref:O-methyltransferase n=1 Tax=unclassified Streptomyces TaxID=2593676 RepID=UPI00344E4AEA